MKKKDISVCPCPHHPLHCYGHPLKCGCAPCENPAGFRAALLSEIAKQNALIERMDYPPNRETGHNGVMQDIRAQRLRLLMELLDFEPAT